jgi:hypothetical protein
MEHWGSKNVDFLYMLWLCVVGMEKLLGDLNVTQELVDDSQITQAKTKPFKNKGKGTYEGESAKNHCGICVFKYYGHKLSHSFCHIFHWQKGCDTINSINGVEINLH